MKFRFENAKLTETKEAPLDFVLAHYRLLSEFPVEKIKEVNVDRVKKFITDQGLKVKPFIIFNEKDIYKVKEIVGGIGLLSKGFSEARGMYIPEIDMVLVMIREEEVEINGQTFVEGVLVHELAHANNEYLTYVTPDKKRYQSPRVGFCVIQDEKPWGWLLEEGWADMLRAEYLTECVANEFKEQIKVGDLDMNDSIVARNPIGKVFPIPLKYLYRDDEDKLVTHDSAFAGYVVELLCEKDPTIRSLMIEARSSISALKNLIRAINKVSPGLYTKLQNRRYSEKSFTDMLIYVINEVCGGIRQVIKVSEPLREEWEQALTN